jgi:hypothetical protein
MATAEVVQDQTEDQPSLNEEEHAEEIPDTNDPPTYGKNNRKLPKQLKDALHALVMKFSEKRDLYDRRIEVLTDRLNRFYDDGVQHVYPNFGTGVYQVGVSGGYVDIGNGDRMECPEYMGAYNIFRARRRSIHAVLTQNPPGIDFIANQLGNPEGEQSAEIAEGYRHFFDQANDTKGIQEYMSLMMCLSGRVVVRTYQTQDRQRWGVNDKGEPRTMETARVYGTLETRVPVTCRDFDKMVFCFVYEDPDVVLAKSQNPWIKKQISAGEAALGESDWERFARLGVRQARKGYYLTGQALSYLTTEMHGWFRPAVFDDGVCDDVLIEEPPDGYEFEPDTDPETGEPGDTVTVGGALKQLFPEGVHVKYIGKIYSESWAEAMDDAIDVGFPDQRFGMTGGALMEPMKVVQDEYNDLMNAERENYEKGWPAKYFKGDQETFEAIADNRSSPAQFHLIKSDGTPGTAADQIYQEPHFDIPESFNQAKEALRGEISQDVTGALPALAGKSQPDQTASGQAMDRSQAMGMLGPAWANMQRLWAGVYTKAVMLAARNPDHGGEIAVAKPDGGKVTIQLKKIKKGTFKAKPDVDSSFPDSTAAKRANTTQLLVQAAPTPLGAAIFEVPDNWEEIVELNGNPDLTLIPAIAFKKQMRELELLLEQAPVPNLTPDGLPAVDVYNQQHASQTLQMAAQAIEQGLPAPPPPPYQPPPAQNPSIMPAPQDFHKWESMKCAVYLSSEDCWLRLNVDSGDPEEMQRAELGVENVRLHMAMHDQMLAMQGANGPGMPPNIPPPVMPGAKPPVTPGAPAGNLTTPPGAPGGATL